jgi:multiple sugar transport system ATP-binding protein
VREAANTKVAVGDNVGMTVSGRHNNWFDKTSGARITAMDSTSLFVG